MKFLKILLMTAFFVSIPVLALAADPGFPVLDTLAQWVLANTPSVAMVGTIAVEVVAKVFPTANPQGWLLWADAACQKASTVLAQLGKVFVALDGVVESVIPQNTTAAAPATPPAPPAA